MAGVAVGLNIEIQELCDNIEKASNNVSSNAINVLKNIANIVFLRGATRVFDLQGARDGHEKWVMLSDNTVIDRVLSRGGKYATKDKYNKQTEPFSKQQIWSERNNMKILRDTGKLAQSINVLSINDSEVVVGTRLNYASKHQFGDKTNQYRGKTAPIPQRQFLFITPNDFDMIKDMFATMTNKIVEVIVT
jgi:phage gpG-like protein